MTRPPGQAFQSCPAATGQLDLDIERCTQFPDGAHRCGEAREHASHHRCTCGRSWASQSLVEIRVGLWCPTSMLRET